MTLKEGVVTEQQEVVNNEYGSRRALDKSRKAQYRLDTQQKKLNDNKQVLGNLRTE